MIFIHVCKSGLPVGVGGPCLPAALYRNHPTPVVEVRSRVQRTRDVWRGICPRVLQTMLLLLLPLLHGEKTDPVCHLCP